MTESILNKSNCVNVVVGIVAEKDNRYLLVEEAKAGIRGLWNFPSGKMHFGEDVLEAAKREFLEETGYQVEVTGVAGIYEYMWDNGEGLTIKFNLYGTIIDAPQQPLADDVLSVKWFSGEELKDIASTDKIRYPGTERLIFDVLDGKRFPLEVLYTTSGPIKGRE